MFAEPLSKQSIETRAELERDSLTIDVSRLDNVVRYMDRICDWVRDAGQRDRQGVTGASKHVGGIVDTIRRRLNEHNESVTELAPGFVALAQELERFGIYLGIQAGGTSDPVARSMLVELSSRWDGEGRSRQAAEIATHSELEQEIDGLLDRIGALDRTDLEGSLDAARDISSWYFRAEASFGTLPEALREKFYAAGPQLSEATRPAKGDVVTAALAARDQFLYTTLLYRIDMCGDVHPNFPKQLAEFEAAWRDGPKES